MTAPAKGEVRRWCPVPGAEPVVSATAHATLLARCEQLQERLAEQSEVLVVARARCERLEGALRRAAHTLNIYSTGKDGAAARAAERDVRAALEPL